MPPCGHVDLDASALRRPLCDPSATGSLCEMMSHTALSRLAGELDSVASDPDSEPVMIATCRQSIEHLYAANPGILTDLCDAKLASSLRTAAVFCACSDFNVRNSALPGFSAQSRQRPVASAQRFCPRHTLPVRDDSSRSPPPGSVGLGPEDGADPRGTSPSTDR